MVLDMATIVLITMVMATAITVMAQIITAITIMVEEVLTHVPQVLFPIPEGHILLPVWLREAIQVGLLPVQPPMVQVRDRALAQIVPGVRNIHDQQGHQAQLEVRRVQALDVAHIHHHILNQDNLHKLIITKEELIVRVQKELLNLRTQVGLIPHRVAVQVVRLLHPLLQEAIREGHRHPVADHLAAAVLRAGHHRHQEAVVLRVAQAVAVIQEDANS